MSSDSAIQGEAPVAPKVLDHVVVLLAAVVVVVVQYVGLSALGAVQVACLVVWVVANCWQMVGQEGHSDSVLVFVSLFLLVTSYFFLGLHPFHLIFLCMVTI